MQYIYKVYVLRFLINSLIQEIEMLVLETENGEFLWILSQAVDIFMCWGSSAPVNCTTSPSTPVL